MITYIEQIKNLGVFNDYKKPRDCKTFEKYNLIYGLNGSGKTTLSRFFKDLKAGKADGFPDLKYKVTLDKNRTVIEGEPFPINIHVFNSDYVDTNLGSCEDEISPIYILGKDNKKLAKTIEVDEKELTILESKLINAKSNIKTEEDKRDTIFTQIANKTKGKLTNPKWRNYNRAKAKDSFRKLDQINAISAREYEDALSSISEQPLALLQTTNIPDLSIKLQQMRTEIQQICENSATSNAIQELLETPSLLTWVEDGMKLHQKSNFDRCNFCEQPFPLDRKQALEDHFSTSDSELKKRIEAQFEPIANLVHLLTQPLDYKKSDFYSELKDKSEEKRTELLEAREEICATLDKYKLALDDKLRRRSESYESQLTIFDTEKVEKALSNYNSVVELNNEETEKFNERISNFEKKVEAYLLSTVIQSVTQIDTNLADLKSKITIYKSGGNQTCGITELEHRIAANKAKISDSHRGADTLSSKLKSFLGRDELNFEQEDKGYRITRYGRPAQRLSEGEKMAVAFIYFTTTLSDKNFNLGQSILVIDDPISSLDSNSIYQAFGFLKTETKDAKQVFYLTHNFDFLKLMLNWLSHSSNNKNSSFWMLHSYLNKEQNRNTNINALDKTLQHCSSEVSYLFKVLYKFNENGGDGTIESTYHLPNVIRKVLEIFLNHHMPRAGMYKQLDDLPFDKQKKSALNKYANDLSHPTMSNIDPALIAETKTNIGHLFEMMETIAPDYYKTLKHEAQTN